MFAAAGMVRVFTNEAAVVAVGEEYLRIVSWSFMASGVIFVASSMFQAMGNTIPSLVSSFTRIVGTALPALARRFPDLTLAVPRGELDFRRLSIVYGVEALPVRLRAMTGPESPSA